MKKVEKKLNNNFEIEICLFKCNLEINWPWEKASHNVNNLLLFIEVRTRPCSEAAKGICTNLCRSRSAQSLKLLGDSATQVRFN